MKSGVHGIIFTDATTNGVIWQRSIGAYRMANEWRDLGLRIQVIDFWSFLTQEGSGKVLKMLEKFIGKDTLFVGFSTTFMNNGVSALYDVKHEKLDTYNYTTSHKGVNAMATDVAVLKEVRDFIKGKNPSINIVVGGARASTGFDPIGDVRILGYGEVHGIDYAKWKLGLNKLFTARIDDNNVRVLDYNSKAEGFDFTNSTTRWYDEDCIQPNETLPIEISRGCIFSCSFCSYPLNGKTKLDYLKSIEILRQEFVSNYERFGTTRYVFSDDTYNDTVEKLEWINEVRNSLPFDLQFATYARLDLIAAKPEQIRLLKENGLKYVFFGIETLNHSAGKSIGKGAKPEKLIDTLHQCREAWGNSVMTCAGFITGLPTDTYASMENWLEQIADPRFPLHTATISPLMLADKTKTYRPWLSDIEKDTAKYGYSLDRKSLWTNTLYGTSQVGCTELGGIVTKYMEHSGRTCAPAHISMAFEDYGFTKNDILISGRVYSTERSYLASKVYQRYISYINDVWNLPEYD